LSNRFYLFQKESEMAGMTSSNKGFRVSTMDILLIAVVAAVGGVVSAYVVGPWAKFIEGVLGPFGAALDNPFFIFWYIIVGLITRKPFLTFIAGMLTGLIEVLAGSLDGSIVFVFVALQALGAELGLLIFRYRPSILAAIVSGALAGIGCAIALTFVFGFVVLPVGSLILLYIAMALGDGIIGGLLAWFVVKGIERTGVMGRTATV
jgi:ABC-type thiamin/hydroxymethylpyrimidine transport system permease subunit